MWLCASCCRYSFFSGARRQPGTCSCSGRSSKVILVHARDGPGRLLHSPEYGAAIASPMGFGVVLMGASTHAGHHDVHMMNMSFV